MEQAVLLLPTLHHLDCSCLQEERKRGKTLLSYFKREERQTELKTRVQTLSSAIQEWQVGSRQNVALDLSPNSFLQEPDVDVVLSPTLPIHQKLDCYMYTRKLKMLTSLQSLLRLGFQEKQWIGWCQE